MAKILHLHVLPLISGSGLNTFLTARGLKALGHEVDFACAPGGRLESLVRDNGIGFIPIRNLVHPIHPIKDLLALWEIYKILKSGEYDIMHTHNSKGGIIGRLAGRMAGTKTVIHTVHGFAFHEYESWTRRMLFIFLEKIFARLCDALIFISQPLIDTAIRLKIGDPKKYFKVYSGIDIGWFQKGNGGQTRKNHHVMPEEKIIGVVSKLWDGKGLADIIKAFAALAINRNNVRLMMVGEGYLERSLKDAAVDLKIADKVIFTGFQYGIPDFTQAMDIVTVGSYFEGMGRVVLEAMACGKPIVATNVGGIPDLVENNKTGILLEPGDIEGFKRAFEKLLDDEKLARDLGENARRKITRQFSSDFMVEEIAGIYELLRHKGTKGQRH
ncbi:MAG: glycosyltransferase family 4 protein [Nitrospinae bacterium]|nr:glycosyltransferase family 4 protein [Nitrospinota bacterium]